MKTAGSQVEKMDRMYRVQRHFYDLTRKYYLFGRDRLLTRMDVMPGQRVLELGCGTARNLIKLARIHPDARLYGLDASEPMLQTARAKIERRGFSQRIELKHELAEQMTPQKTFGLSQSFDVAFFSYTLSMIPTWREALQSAYAGLKPGGKLHIVDFWDQKDLPGPFRAALQQWLALFDVHHRPELPDYLQELATLEKARLNIESWGRRYAILAYLEKPGLPR